jgi:DNA repair protein RecN (Recombination protein N)
VLVELRIRDLGVIAEASLVLGPGMTALTGETGAGKTMLVEAIELLVGGRADPVVVRAGADEAVVEGRFVVADADAAGDGELEVVATRVVPRVGRSRAYLDGRLAPAAALAELGAGLVDLHGQHAHQSLLATATQRQALDRFGAVDLAPLDAARARLAVIDAQLDALGGDDRARAREIDLLRFQVDELDAAAVDDPDEDARLDAEEDALADATAHQEAAQGAVASLVDDGGALDAVGAAIAALHSRGPFAAHEVRLRDAAAELADAAADVRAAGEAIDDDPERLAAVRSRRQLLHELRRKYGETLAEVIAYGDDCRDRLASLLDHDRRAAALDAERIAAAAEVDAAAVLVARARRAAAAPLAGAVQEVLADLAMAKAVVEVSVGETPPGDDVAILLAANPGAAPAPLAKVASGGELARTMLAVRLVLTRASAGSPDSGGGPATLVFDEVDAGIGGTAALAVGRALAGLAGPDRQVLVVTHLAQVAACADTQIAVTKVDDGATTHAHATVAAGADRVAELARMLAGTPGSDTTRAAAAELLATATEERVA